MAKTVRLEPIGEETSIQTNGNILSVLLKNELNVLHECGGRGMCATCHVYIKSGMEGLSSPSRRERRTIEVITSANKNILPPLDGRILVEAGKLVTRSMITQLQDTRTEVTEYLNHASDT